MGGDDERPPVWIGHVTLRTTDLDASHAFMQKIGMRPIAEGDDFAVLELRGGTHLVLVGAEESEASAGFDLMVEDLDETHRRFAEMGLAPSEIRTGNIHRSFQVVDPSGAEITFNSSHASDRAV